MSIVCGPGGLPLMQQSRLSLQQHLLHPVNGCQCNQPTGPDAHQMDD